MTRTIVRALIAASLLMSMSSTFAAQYVVIADTIEPFPGASPVVDEPQSPDTQSESPAALSGPASFSVSGTVVSATTGTPLDRTEVTLFTSGPNGSQLAESITTENGSFRFDRLQAGRYRIQAFRRGYIAAGYQEHDGFATGIVTGPDLVTSGLRLQLFPTAVIGGAITDDSGEPVPGAQVRLFRQDHRTGEDKIINTQTDITDDTGTYEFSRVRAGTFYISVSASPWYAFHPSPKTDSSGNLIPADEQPHSPLDVAYPTTYYENGADSDSATPVTVAAGDHVEADFSLHAVPAIHIQVHLPPPVEGRGMPMPQLAQRVFGADEYSNATPFTAGTTSGGMVADFSGIAPGHYVLRQSGQPGESNRTASVDLTANLAVDFASAAVGGVDVSGKIAMASGDSLPARTRVSLAAAGNGPARQGELVAGDGTFTFHSVPPGRYDVLVFASDARLAIRQMMATGAEVQGNRVTVAAQPVLLAATLARGATAIAGYARQNGKPLGGAMILLVPRNAALRDLYCRDQSNTDGSFTLSRVVPGNYTLVAIESGWTLDWGRPEVLAPYLARGLRVHVAGQRSLDLPTPVEVQPR